MCRCLPITTRSSAISISRPRVRWRRDPADPNSVPEKATLSMTVPPKTASMQVQLTYVDGSTSPLRTFNAVAARTFIFGRSTLYPIHPINNSKGGDPVSHCLKPRSPAHMA